MGKVKIKKQDVWIDMTPMSDVMVLLLTFFMMTSTFVKNEPAKVLTPSSVSEIKVPEKDALTILVDSVGKVFMGMDNQGEIREVLSEITGLFGVSLSAEQQANFLQDAMWGVPIENLDEYLKLDVNEMNKYIQSATLNGRPLGKCWFSHSDVVNGGKLEFEMGPRPNKSWGVGIPPFSQDTIM